MGMLLIRKRRKVNQEPQTESINLTEVNGEEEPQTDFNNMTVADLKNHAEENSIDLNGATKKADIINAIIGDTNG